MERAKYALGDVFSLINRQKYWFSAPSQSVNEVIRVYAASESPNVKFVIADEEEIGLTEPWLQEISFHPPQNKFTTLGGVNIGGGGKI